MAVPIQTSHMTLRKDCLSIDGQLNLTIHEAITVQAGELFVVPGGFAHGVAPGSAGTLIIFDA